MRCATVRCGRRVCLRRVRTKRLVDRFRHSCLTAFVWFIKWKVLLNFVCSEKRHQICKRFNGDIIHRSSQSEQGARGLPSLSAKEVTHTATQSQKCHRISFPVQSSGFSENVQSFFFWPKEKTKISHPPPSLVSHRPREVTQPHAQIRTDGRT